MIRTGFVLICILCFACKSKKPANDVNENGFSYNRFSASFKNLQPPFQMTDADVAANKDTTVIRSAAFAKFLPDSLRSALFGKNVKLRFVAIAHLPAMSGTNLFLVKASSATRKAVLIYAFDRENFSTVIPFLAVDNDPSTSQVSAVDRGNTFTRTVTQRTGSTITGEGKDVFDYDAAHKRFSLILTNPLHVSQEIINPIDTLSRRQKFSGDYVRDKKNFISIRDGRYPNQLQIFFHIDGAGGKCTGEFKGDLLMTSTTTAIYRINGDRCVMNFRFTTSGVTVKEDSGCGAHRGLDCSFDGTYPKRKAPAKAAAAKR